MKKKLYLLSTILLSAAVLSLSSCLKDNRYIDFSKVGTVVDFPLGGQANFGGDAITDAGDTIVRQFAVNVASPNLPTTATTVTLAVDNTIVTAYPTTPVAYLTMPAGSYVFNATTVTIPAGQQYATVSVTFYKSKLDASKSYMLPIKIVKSSVGTISGNFGIHYFHFIGNDFAGVYSHDFIRTPSGGDFTGEPATFLPDSHTQFEVAGGYYTGDIRYVVSYNETGSYPNASYTDVQISINPDDVARIASVPIAITTPPSIVGYNPTVTYDYNGMLTLFANGFTYGANSNRINLDKYTK